MYPYIIAIMMLRVMSLPPLLALPTYNVQLYNVIYLTGNGTLDLTL